MIKIQRSENALENIIQKFEKMTNNEILGEVIIQIKKIF